MPSSGPAYVDCNATTPLDPKVRSVVLKYLEEEFGNDGSRTHEFGTRAKQAVQHARDLVAAAVDASRDEVLFTSGATESNNLAILGLREHAVSVGRKHIVCSAIEHKAVLEPIGHLGEQGFLVSHVMPDEDGVITPEAVKAAITPETVLVSVMHVNNETGAIQPIREIAAALGSHPAFFHVDAAQSFGKLDDDLKSKRIDLISISGHKLYAPKGIGALVSRRRGYDRIPLKPLQYGGGQERGLRPGTVPVYLAAALGRAIAVSIVERTARRKRCEAIRAAAIKAFRTVGVVETVPLEKSLYTTINVSFPGIDSEALMLALKDHLAFSNGSACTSSSYTPSHVLKAMGVPSQRASECVRMSWCHLTPDVDWVGIAKVIAGLQGK